MSDTKPDIIKRLRARGYAGRVNMTRSGLEQLERRLAEPLAPREDGISGYVKTPTWEGLVERRQQVRVSGEPGWFTFHAHVVNSVGDEWLDLHSRDGGWRCVRPDRVRRRGGCVVNRDTPVETEKKYDPATMQFEEVEV